MATANITKVNNRNYRDRYFSHAKVYVSRKGENGADLIDEWFNDNTVRELVVKSTAWAFLRRIVNGIESGAIAKALEIPAENVRFSQKAGCSCGCSPGFIAKGSKFTSQNVWADIEYSESDLDEIREALNSQKLVKKFEKDLIKNAAEVKRRELERIEEERAAAERDAKYAARQAERDRLAALREMQYAVAI
jgi:hypothetical protein